MVGDDHAHQSGSTVYQSFSVATIIHPIASARSMAVSGPPRRPTSRSEKSRQRVAVETATVCFMARAWSRTARSRGSGSPDGSQDRDLSALPRIRAPEVLWCSRVGLLNLLDTKLELLDTSAPRYAPTTRFYSRRGGRAVEGIGLENRQGESSRGFESHPLRHPPSPPLGAIRSAASRRGRGYLPPPWRGGRVAEGAPLLRVYGLIAHRGFESLPLRH